MEGRCTCGALRYRLGTLPLFTHCCHCRWCQRQTGSACVVAARVAALTGCPLSRSKRRRKSGHPTSCVTS